MIRSYTYRATLFINGVRTPSGQPTPFTITSLNPIQIQIVSVAGNDLLYQLIANVQRSSEARLNTLTIAGYSIPFSPDTYSYSLSVPSTQPGKHLSISCTTVQQNAVPRMGQFGGGAGGFANGIATLNYLPPVGPYTTIWVNVTAQNLVTVLSYQIYVTMTYDLTAQLKPQPDGIATVEPYPITLNSGTYSWTVPSSLASQTVFAAATFNATTISIAGSSGLGQLSVVLPLAFGINSIPVTLTSESTTTTNNLGLSITRQFCMYHARVVCARANPIVFGVLTSVLFCCDDQTRMQILRPFHLSPI